MTTNIIDDHDLDTIRRRAAIGCGAPNSDARRLDDTVVALVDAYLSMRAEREALHNLLDTPVSMRHSLNYALGQIDSLLAFQKRVKEAAR